MERSPTPTLHGWGKWRPSSCTGTVGPLAPHLHEFQGLAPMFLSERGLGIVGVLLSPHPRRLRIITTPFTDGRRFLSKFHGIETLKKLPVFTATEVGALLQWMVVVLQTGLHLDPTVAQPILSPNRVKVYHVPPLPALTPLPHHFHCVMCVCVCVCVLPSGGSTW